MTTTTMMMMMMTHDVMILIEHVKDNSCIF